VVFQFSFFNYLTDETTWYSHEIFLGCAGILFLLMLVKWRSKWVGILTLNRNTARYGIFYTARLSRKFLNWTYLFYGTEAVVSIVFPFIYLYFDQKTWPFAALLFLNGIEGVYFLLRNSKSGNFKLGINNNAIVHNARGTYVLPFHELKSVVYKYDEYFFIYDSGETLTIPEYIVDPEDMPALRQHINKKAAEQGIFVTEKLRDK
jgi:hypothetical protein